MNLFRLLLLALLASASHAAVPGNIVRPNSDNASSTSSEHAPSVSLVHGGFAPPVSAPNSAGRYLTEYSFGGPFATYLSPYSTFADDVLFNGRPGIPAVYSVLYPPGYKKAGGVTGSRSQIESGGAAFRYKYLIYGSDPSDPERIINIYEETFGAAETLFTDTDRGKVRDQINVLREALAIDPQNDSLQQALLDLYYDWTVAESQLARRKLTSLASHRLGLTAPLPDPFKFIIDAEIATNEELVTIMESVIKVYEELFAYLDDGVDPSDYDPSAGGATLGYYLFKTLVPYRNQTPTEYADDSGGVVDVIDPEADNPRFDPNEPDGPDNPRKLGGFATFSGYKDYRTLLTILGQYIQYQADLARLRGTRRSPGDITTAREGLTAIQEQADLACFLATMFEGVDFNDSQYDNTGIRAAQTLVTNAINDAADVRTFVNGTSNIFGLDPEFLLLVPSNGEQTTDETFNKFDSYDILAARLTKLDDAGLPVGPLAIASKALGNPLNPSSGGGANQAFFNFRSNVDQVIAELTDLQQDFADRFVQLTGYTPDASPGFIGEPNPSPTAPSELKTANAQIDNLRARNVKLLELTDQLIKEAADAQKAVTLAQGIESTITGAQATYLNDTAGAWTELHVWAGAAAGAQATYDTLSDLSGIDAASQLVTGGSVGVMVGVAGAANAVVQTSAAVRTSMREQEISEAAVALDIKIATAGLPLTVQQAIIELNALYREGLSNKLEIQDNFAALTQAIADRNAIIREADRLQKRHAVELDVLATSYYADPIFYIRAEKALLEADNAFRDAQRWLFYTCRALEYKWQQRFSFADAALGISYDIGSIIKARNSVELETIRQKMASFNLTRTNGTGPSTAATTVISLRDEFITPNPNRSDTSLVYNPFLSDNGKRWDPDQKRYVDKVALFRELLKNEYIVESPISGGNTVSNLVIEFNTSLLHSYIGDFFRGADVSNPNVPQSGFYRDKIWWASVHLLTEDGPAAPQASAITGALQYSGNTYFRTRIPENPFTLRPLETKDSGDGFKNELDIPGEYIVAPVRYYEDTLLNGRFELQDRITDNKSFAESSTSARNVTSATFMAISDPNNNFRSVALKERSVAVSRMVLQINGVSGDGILDFIDRLEDIEIIIKHQAYPRPEIKPFTP